MIAHIPDKFALPEIAAVVVTFHPDHAFLQRLSLLLEQVARVVIVDNNSDQTCLLPWAPKLAEEHRVTLLRNTENLGIAAALNQGIHRLVDEGYQWVLTLDQDSICGTGMVAALRHKIEADPDSSSIAIVGVNRQDPIDPNSDHLWLRPKNRFPFIPFFERVTCGKLGYEGTTAVITSGSLVNVGVFQQIGAFRDEMFIDLVDTEYCLRARRTGYRIVVACDANLIHRIGEKRKVSILGMGIVATHHAPLRRYYLFRNTVTLMREYFRVHPHWIIYHSLALGQILLGIVLLESRKFAALRACLLGIYDGVRGKIGPTDSEF